MSYQSKITAKGQTTIPQEVREYLHLKPGDRIHYVMVDGKVTMIAKNRHISELAGILGKPPHGAGSTIEEMNEAIADYLGEDDERIKREWHEARK